MLRHVQVNGVTLSVEDVGTGPAVILLHAGVADQRMWDPQMDLLKDSYRVIRWDARGFGKTPHVPGPFSYAADVVGVMDALEVPEAMLIGCSFGGGTAIRVAAENPGRVSRLVLIGSGPYGYVREDLVPPEAEEIDEAYGAKDWEKALALEVKVWILGRDREATDVDPQFLELSRDMIRSGMQPANGSQSVDGRTSDLGRLNQLTMPVLLVVGSEDTDYIMAAAHLLDSTLPVCRLEMIENAAHLPSLERAERFNKILSAWLTETASI